MEDKDIKSPEETKVEDKKEETKEPEAVKGTEEKKPEEKKEPKAEPKKEPEEAKVDVEALKTELAEAQAKAQEVETLNIQVTTLQNEVADKDAQIKEYETLVGNMVEAKMNQVPADLKDLIPDNMDLKQKLAWLEKAESKGIFNKETKKKPNVEVGKPMNTETPTVDTSKMTAGQLLKMAYSSAKK